MECNHSWPNIAKPKPQLKVHEVAEMRNKQQYIHMTLTKVDGTNYNVWVFVNEDGSAYVDISMPYES